MRNFFGILTLVSSMTMAPSAFAGERTITFAIDHMTCVACPYTVKSSMAAVTGVSSVVVSFEAKTATVTFDDSKTDSDAIAAASTNAGYPAHLAQQGS
jgi:periplasmic mercuric ion binding protein